MAVVPPEGQNTISRISTRHEQPGGRRGVPTDIDLSRMETGQESFPESLPHAQAMPHGGIYLSPFHSNRSGQRDAQCC